VRNVKVAVLGLDSVPPDLLFDKLLEKLPTIRKMVTKGIHGSLRTCDPPITVPAWMVMFTGKNPGKLGIYGFRHRRAGSYTDGYIVNSTHVREPKVWDKLGERGLRSVVVGVPPSYPPVKMMDGAMVSCFLTPSQERPFTYPPELKDEILKLNGGKYEFDVVFRTEDRSALKKDLFEMTSMRFDVAEHLAKTQKWDFFALHEIGFDRLHHAFWKFVDPSHPKYVKGNEYESVFVEYYSMVDGRIKRLLDIFGDDCTTFVLSDHGSKGMRGAFCINEWLAKEGYLVYKRHPKSVVDFEKAEIDWAKTKAWGWGGYYARIFFNVKGREPSGLVAPSDLPKEIRRLRQKIELISDDKGRRMKNSVFEPLDLYGVAIGDRPDLMVYFDNLDWRSAGTVGHGSLYLSENDTGPDDSVHSMEGVFLMNDPKRDLGGKLIEGARIEDIAPTLMRLFGFELDRKDGLDGRVLTQVFEGRGS
jgi:predicted AlkP superfamily phosphohydrolase/phosphomutase